jgi:glycosyltransferase involved in cell wall biosynthesis
MISILILTKNEEKDLPDCLESVSWSNDIHVFDSFSEDKTVDIAINFGAKITQRKFDNWSTHQNWGLRNIKFKNPWVLYIDADERVSSSLYKSLTSLDTKRDDIVAYYLKRRDFAWDGTWLKHAQISPYYLRLFKPEKIEYIRLVNPISIPHGPTSKMKGYLDHYPFSKGFKYWFQRHLWYAEMEAIERLKEIEKNNRPSIRKAFFCKDYAQRRRHQKSYFYRFPARPVIKWFYMMFIRFAFLDGLAGITYATLQSVYEYFIVLYTRELNNKRKSLESIDF